MAALPLGSGVSSPRMQLLRTGLASESLGGPEEAPCSGELQGQGLGNHGESGLWGVQLLSGFYRGTIISSAALGAGWPGPAFQKLPRGRNGQLHVPSQPVWLGLREPGGHQGQQGFAHLAEWGCVRRWQLVVSRHHCLSDLITQVIFIHRPCPASRGPYIRCNG